jgi:hypothetical protein
MPSAIASTEASRISIGAMLTSRCYTIGIPIQEQSIVEQMQQELTRIGSPVPTTALRALVGIHHGETLPAERLGRILGYERQSFLKRRRPPRIAVALTPDARPTQPQRLAVGDWRLGRRIVTPDALRGQAAALGARLCVRAREVPQARELLRPHMQDAAGAAFGRIPVSNSDWSSLDHQFLQAQPRSLGALSREQEDAEQALESQQISGLVLYFGSDEAVVTATPLSTLRAPLPGEPGEAFDDLVRRRAGDSAIAREVLAFIQEWGHVEDELDRPATIEDYVQRWRVSEYEARERLRLFHQVLPGEHDPGSVWRLLWDSVPAHEGFGEPAFVRLISQPVIVGSELPTLASYFLASLYEQLPRPLGSRLHSAGLQPQAEPQDPRRDLRRLYKLADRATHEWSALALATEGRHAEPSLLGLKSLEHILDHDAAAIAEQNIGSYRQTSSTRGTRAVLLNAQKCLRICADISLLDPPSAVTPLLPGARWAASSFVALCSLEAVDPVEEANATMATLYATS